MKIKNPTPPTVFAAHTSNFAQTLRTKLQRASRSRIFDFHPRSPLKKFKIFRNFLKVDFSIGSNQLTGTPPRGVPVS